MLLTISFVAIFVIIFVFFYFFLTFDPKLEKSDKVKGRIRMFKKGEAADAAPTEQTPSIFRDMSVSDIPALNVMLTKFQQTAMLQKLIDQSNVRVKAGMLLLASAMLAMGGFAFSLMILELSLLSCWLWAVGLAALPIAYIAIMRWRRFHRFESQFPQALDLLARALKAGYSFSNALEMTAAELSDPVSLELKVIFNLQSLGWTLRQTLINFVERVPLPDVKLFVTAVLIHKDIGGNLAEVLENAASVIRQRFVLRRQLRAMTAQARMSGYLMTGLPFFVIVGLFVLAPEYIKPMFQDDLGKGLLQVAGFMLFTGIFVIRWLLRIKEL
ncbi:MAG: type II secretion system F family protein [Acidobacteria bacterium]|nr:type II secretion system F family protein [Acidobacteriota bacterium]MBI3655978.1 type II secretion system F family protein [Acidobacteriota bacterium]